MQRLPHSVSALSGRPFVLALGGVYVAIAVVWMIANLLDGMSAASVLVVGSFIGGSGLIVLLGGYRLARTDLHPQFYPTVSRWSISGIVVMLLILGLYHAQPDTGLSEPTRSLPILTGFSCVAGFGVGVYDARAKSNAYELERRNRELDRLRRDLQTSNERLEQFAHVASHDLQEPLRMVSTYLQLLEQRYGDEFNEDAVEFLEYAVDGADRMREMIEALLEYSRVETQGNPLEPVELDAVLADVRKDLELRIDETEATVEVADLPRVRGDDNQLRQLLQNLVSNAIDYSGDEPPHVEVSAEREDGAWLVSVADEGVGIDPDEQDRIFEVFQRLHSHDEQPGTGIGLALCKRIVERHGGELWVDSQPGEGSTFTFTLPPVEKQVERSTPSQLDEPE